MVTTILGSLIAISSVILQRFSVEELLSSVLTTTHWWIVIIFMIMQRFLEVFDCHLPILLYIPPKSCRLFSGGAIYSSEGNSCMLISTCRIDGNSASLGGGLYIGEYHHTVSIDTSLLQRNIGDFGGGAYFSSFSTGIAINEVAVQFNEAVNGGGLYTIADDCSSTESLFLYNVATSFGAIYSQAKVVSLVGCNFAHNRARCVEGMYGGVFTTGAVSVFINTTHFLNNSAGTGGGLGVTDCESVAVLNSDFVLNLACEVDGGALLSHDAAINVSQCNFTGNSAKGSGGAIHISNAASASISFSVFDNNSVVAGNGAGVWLSSSIFDVASNAFSNNRALMGGGTVFWQSSTMSEPLNITSINWYSSNNTARYGHFVATEITNLVLDAENSYVVNDYAVQFRN